MGSSDDTDALARGLLDGALDAPVRAASAVGGPAGIRADALLSAMLSAAGQADDPVGAIERTLTAIEAFSSATPVVGGALLALLYPAADAATLHEICDAIELNLYDVHDAALAEALEQLASQDPTPAGRERCQRWAAAIRSPAPG